MNTYVRPADARGLVNFGWLQSRHSFSFGNYYDPAHMGFGVLRVINEDAVAPGQGFGAHSHQDMEIISWVTHGALEHKDSMGNGSIIKPGDVQRMSAGTGVTHSEFNASGTKPVGFLQIWVLPQYRGIRPSYEQLHFPESERTGELRLIVSPDGRSGSVTINQDVSLFTGLLNKGTSTQVELEPGRQVWVQIIRGEVDVAGHSLKAGDGIGVKDLTRLDLASTEASEVMVFDLPKSSRSEA